MAVRIKASKYYFRDIERLNDNLRTHFPTVRPTNIKEYATLVTDYFPEALSDRQFKFITLAYDQYEKATPYAESRKSNISIIRDGKPQQVIQTTYIRSGVVITRLRDPKTGRYIKQPKRKQ